MPVCRRKGYEQGLWFEKECLARTIEIKELTGKDASFERKELKYLSKMTQADLNRAEAPIDCQLSTRGTPKSGRFKQLHDKIPQTNKKEGLKSCFTSSGTVN